MAIRKKGIRRRVAGKGALNPRRLARARSSQAGKGKPIAPPQKLRPGLTKLKPGAGQSVASRQKSRRTAMRASGAKATGPPKIPQAAKAARTSSTLRRRR